MGVEEDAIKYKLLPLWANWKIKEMIEKHKIIPLQRGLFCAPFHKQIPTPTAHMEQTLYAIRPSQLLVWFSRNLPTEYCCQLQERSKQYSDAKTITKYIWAYLIGGWWIVRRACMMSWRIWNRFCWRGSIKCWPHQWWVSIWWYWWKQYGRYRTLMIGRNRWCSSCSRWSSRRNHIDCNPFQEHKGRVVSDF